MPQLVQLSSARIPILSIRYCAKRLQTFQSRSKAASTGTMCRLTSLLIAQKSMLLRCNQKLVPWQQYTTVQRSKTSIGLISAEASSFVSKDVEDERIVRVVHGGERYCK